MKKILLSLFVGLIGFISFGYCDNYTRLSSSIPGNSCVVINSGLFFYWSNSSCQSYIHFSGFDTPAFDLNTLYVYNYDVEVCNGRTSQCSYYYYDNLEINQCDDPYTSLECQTEYNLIPIEDIDINYCVGNGLCPNESGTGDFSGDLQFSNIYINNIFHPGRQNIFVTIPDYITWDYAFTGDDFNIYVGSGYDEEYINSIIKINSYRPTTTDFSDIFISGLTLIFPYIVVTLFIVFVWRLLKRIFK